MYHLSMVWAYMVATLTGCSYHAKNYITYGSCSRQEERLACSSNPHLCKLNDAREFDDFLEGVIAFWTR
ncbi:MAG: hypothetical protein V3581_03910 [Candidatus Cardinium sp.]|uniref:hypothetical protein n=1 Tax=Candidatus Cardinium sp. TP TaxID=2961955 RepID=UPI0021B0574A|nr:hypothetical protein [Candidatus Cardinium sp. TP]MCT4697051.1 hypothetical protein [Candidatus Cardinium sp. TP]MDN5246655.1 hypothetical protein [Candidatus Cardinium sp.]